MKKTKKSLWTRQNTPAALNNVQQKIYDRWPRRYKKAFADLVYAYEGVLRLSTPQAVNKAFFRTPYVAAQRKVRRP